MSENSFISKVPLVILLCHAGLPAQSWQEFADHGDLAIARGQYEDANKYFTAALGQLPDSSVPDHRLARIVSRQGAVKHLLGDFESAITLFRRAIEIWEQIAGSELNLAGDFHNLGQAECELGRYDAAERSFKRSLSLAGFEGPEAAAHRISTLNWLGIVYTRQAKYTEAERSLSDALALHRETTSHNGQALAHLLNSKAELDVARGDLKSAELLFEQALGLYETELGADHPTTAVGLSNLASVYLRQGRGDRAQPLLQRALRIQERLLGPAHPQVANALKDLGLLNAVEGKYSIAEPLLKRALAIEEKIFGTNYPRLAMTLNQLAMVYVNAGKYGAAEPILQRATALGSGEPALMEETALAMKYLALVYRHEAKFPQAELAYQQAIDLWQKAGPNDPRLLSVMREYLLLIRRDRRLEMQELQNRIKMLESRKGLLAQ